MSADQEFADAYAAAVRQQIADMQAILARSPQRVTDEPYSGPEPEVEYLSGAEADQRGTDEAWQRMGGSR